MKRDWDLVRAILEKLSQGDGIVKMVTAADIDGWNTAMINYHIGLLRQADLVVAIEQEGPVAVALTWSGWELRDSMHDDRVWKEIKRKAAAAGLELTLPVVQMLSLKIVSELLP